MQLLKRFYKQVYINLVLETHIAYATVIVQKGTQTLSKLSKEFIITNATPTQEIIDFIEHHERRSPFSYVSLLYTGTRQSGRAGCSSDGHYENVALCYNATKKERTKWSATINATALSTLQNHFKQSGIDFIFSTFFVLERAFVKETMAPKPQMFVLNLFEGISVAVFANGQLQYATQLRLDKNKSSENFASSGNEELSLESDNLGVDELDMDMDINLDDDEALESLDTFEDLEDLEELDGLDTLDESHSFEEPTMHDTQKLSLDIPATKESNKLKGATQNYRRFELIKQAIGDFYHAMDIQSSFIETLYVATLKSEENDLSSYLRDELFLDVIVKPIDFDTIMLEIIEAEVAHAS